MREVRKLERRLMSRVPIEMRLWLFSQAKEVSIVYPTAATPEGAPSTVASGV